MSSSETMFGKILDGKGSVTVQTATLVAICYGVWQASGYAVRAEAKLAGIEVATDANTKATKELTLAVGEIRQGGSQALAAYKAEVSEFRRDFEARLAKAEGCLRAGRRKCP